VADRLAAAAGYLRSEGLRPFARAALRRLGDIAALSAGRSPDWSAELPDVVERLCVGGVRPGALVWAMQKGTEMSALLELAASLRARCVVEIGTAAGGVLHLLARVAEPDALIVSVDLPGGRFGGGYGAWRRPLYARLVRRSQELALLRADSHSPETLRMVTERLAGRPVDLLFIDGDHTLAGVAADFGTYAPLVRTGGVIALHDIAATPGEQGIEVPEFWRSLKSRYDTREFVDPVGPAGYGIGVVTWRT
jgi:predicted O-methyltransferase YrrM